MKGKGEVMDAALGSEGGWRKRNEGNGRGRRGWGGW